MEFTIQEVMDLTETWLVTGDLNPEMLAKEFKFSSPYWSEGANRGEFLEKFLDPLQYRQISLDNIVRFDPIIRLTDSVNGHFAIIFQYHTKNGSSVWETVLGTIESGMLSELRSIYDLDATRQAHGMT